MGSLIVNGYADIYKDNRWKHLRTHTMSNRRSIITTGLKLFCISVLTEPALSTVNYCYGFQNSEQLWQLLLSVLYFALIDMTVIPGHPHSVQQIHVKTLWGFMSTQAGLSLLWINLSFCRFCCAPAHLQLGCTTLYVPFVVHKFYQGWICIKQEKSF